MKSAEISIFGIPLWYKSNTPRTVISPTVQPGECWSFQGFPGYLVLKLNNNVYVTGFTLEHIPKSLAPNGRIDSAPKIFTVWVIIASPSFLKTIQNSNSNSNVSSCFSFCRALKRWTMVNRSSSVNTSSWKMAQVCNIFRYKINTIHNPFDLTISWNCALNQIMATITIHACIDFVFMEHSRHHLAKSLDGASV